MLNRLASLAMPTSVLEALPGKLDIKRHSPSILYTSASLAMSTSVLEVCRVNLISKDTHLVFSISRQASLCQQVFSKPFLVNLISKDTHLVFSYVSSSLAMSTSILKDLPGKLDIKRHSPSILYYLAGIHHIQQLCQA